MKKYLCLISLAIVVNSVSASSVPSPSPQPAFASIHADPISYFSSLSIKDIEKIARRKLRLKEKLAVKIFQWKIKKEKRINGGFRDTGRVAMIFGILGIVSVLIPVVGILVALGFMTLAFIFGYKARREDPGNRNARTAIVLAWITLGLVIITTVLLVLILSSMSFFSWG